METGSVYWRGIRSEPLSLEDAKAVTMESFLKIFEARPTDQQALLPATTMYVNVCSDVLQGTHNACTWACAPRHAHRHA